MPKPTVSRVKVDVYEGFDIPVEDMIKAMRVVKTLREFYQTNKVLDVVAFDLISSQLRECYTYWETHGMLDTKETTDAKGN